MQNKFPLENILHFSFFYFSFAINYYVEFFLVKSILK
jgi:hypothetical protein